jgi:hypothetical protein
MTEKDEPVGDSIPPNAKRQTLEDLARKGLIEWHGGKPKGLRGIVVRGEPVSETIIRDRR